MPKKTITIRLAEPGGRLDVATLISALQDTVAVLKGIEQSITEKNSSSYRWYISSIKMNSPLEATLERERIKPKKKGDPRDPEVISPFLKGIRQIGKTAKAPRYFGEPELTRVKRIVDLQKNGLTSVEFFIKSDDVVKPGSNTSDHIETILGNEPVRPYKQYAELEGRLEDLSLHPEVPQFAIYDPLTDQPIGCNFNESDLELVTDLLKQTARVRVSGVAQFNRQHIPVSINIEKIEKLQEQCELPQIDDLHAAGIKLTDGTDPVDMVRGIRNGR